MTDVWIVSITHHQGNDITAHTTEAGARQYLADYCREWWHELEGISMPSSEADIIREWFVERPNEIYSLFRTWLRPQGAFAETTNA